MESPESLERLLLWLSKNGASGALKYEEIRKKLIYLFTCRGCQVPEELTDETIDRTARAIGKPGFLFEGDPIAYFRGVARNVHLEWLRQDRRFSREPVSEAYAQPPAPPVGGTDKDVLLTCLERCLGTISVTKRELLLGYYASEKKEKIDRRQRIADESGIGLNALRIQLFRLRGTIRDCVQKCAADSEI